MEKKKFTRIVKLVSILSACVVFALTLVAVVQFFQISAANKKKSNIKNQLTYIAQEKYDIETAISEQKRASNAERYAREKLGYINDGDIIYEVEKSA